MREPAAGGIHHVCMCDVHAGVEVTCKFDFKLSLSLFSRRETSKESIPSPATKLRKPRLVVHIFRIPPPPLLHYCSTAFPGFKSGVGDNFLKAPSQPCVYFYFYKSQEMEPGIR